MAFKKQILENFIGGGITLPIRLVNGRVPVDTGFDLIRSSIQMILSWNYGDRFFLNEFGSKLESLLEEPNDQVLNQLIQTFIIEAVSVWETRVELISSKIDRISQYRIDISLNYKIVNTQQEDTFVFPFYRQIIY